MISVLYKNNSLDLLTQYVYSFSNFLRNLNENNGFNKIIQSVAELSDNNNYLHIVIADDDDDDKELFIEAMSYISNNIKVTTASNGKDLLDLLHTGALPDIIFMDLNMPVMSGFQCLSKIKQDPKLMVIPVLIYSTSANLEQIEETYLQGATRYIQKPSSFQNIKQLLRSILELTPKQIFTPSSRNEFLFRLKD